ncbi:unnamed protein product [Taenia asiatica]|uniref:EGF-like domain-containing protein n=1 Tax=Taenia asiatica TaxID=60517 RepID=A0A158R6V2_TAEAS|nr:unnamed protein product [Taenia asiatica]
MHLGLTYDSSRNCDESPYKVTVCIGHKLDKCRIFGPHLFYVQAACAAYGPKEVIQFEVDSVEEPLRVDATIKATNSDKEFQLQPVTANLTFPRPIDAKTKNLKIILQFQFAYTCVADYFGELCDVFCSSEAKEYRCSLTGEKICNPGYIKDNETGACIYDRCGSMPNYCLNGGRCVNKAQDEEDALDTTTMPICICPPTRMGARCEIFRSPPLSTPTSTTTTNVIPAVANSSIINRPSDRAISETLRRQPKNNVSLARLSKDSGDILRSSGALEQPSPERELWYQVMVFTVVAVCLTILAFGVCLVAGCYVVRLKAKAALLRRHQVSHFGDMQFVDGGCLNGPGAVGPGSVGGGVSGGAGGGIPVYLQRLSSLDYNSQIPQRPPSVRSFALSRPPTTSSIPLDTAQTPTEQPFVFSNGFNRHAETLGWPPVYRSPTKTWGDFSFDTFTRAPPATTAAGGMDLSAHGDTLPTVNSPEAYACRHDPYGYLSELHNHLSDNLVTSAPIMNNMLTLRTSSIPSPTIHQQTSKSPTEVEDSTMDMRKNDFQMAPASPPSEFADLVIK